MELRALLKYACLIVALVFALIWLLATTSVIGSVPAWIPPSGLFALALGVLL